MNSKKVEWEVHVADMGHMRAEKRDSVYYHCDIICMKLSTASVMKTSSEIMCAVIYSDEAS
jgi:hypothetical protein